ncbi:MAG: alpha/beta fold hydrolase [Deltaproteobacteria bacterium]|nr:alpha/beta fold hydrolase [Deltaproteobacteria bacterium]
MGSVDWTFDGTWPYEPNWFDAEGGRLHYIDEGPRDGRPVVCVHGNPTWGYLYRHFVPPLVEAGYRAVVPDHLGFGRSDKPNKASLYQIPRHSERLISLMDALGLRDATVAVHDWGGPIGLSWPAKRPDNVRNLFIMNTFAHRPPPGTTVPSILRFIRAPIFGEALIKGRHAFVKQLLFKAIRRDRLTDQSRAAYLAPHPTYASRTGILVFPREIPDSPTGRVADFLDEVHQGLAAYRDRPVAFAWGKKDPVFPPRVYERLWKADFPDAPILWLDKAGHFLQEDAPELIVPHLLEHLAR